jgi:hypothetical protein
MESICFVSCVESGPLEAQTVRMAESIRRFGGSLADSEILAITPRFGPPLARQTRKRFKELGVRHERIPSHPSYAWYHYLNTPLAMAAAEELSDATLLGWLDSDVLFLGEPEEFKLAPDVDFAAAVTDNGVVGSTGEGSPHEADWRALCELLEIDVETLPWVMTYMERERIRLYFQAGIFIYRRGLGFSKFYLDMCTQVLDARFGFSHSAEHFTDQICLGLAMFKFGLRWRQLSDSHNFAMASFLPEQYSREDFRATRVLHYHDGLGPHFYAEMLDRLERSHPDVHAWLSAEQPLTDPAPRPHRVLREGLRVARGLPRRRYRLQMRSA